MGQNPLNLALRFFLELAALYFIGYWSWAQHEGVLRYLLVIGLPLLAATIWGVFRVPGDGGAPRVRVSGVVRLLIEIVFFGAATWGLFEAGATTTGLIFGGLTLFHYIISYDRIGWLLKQ
jgi:Protein of unknown function (DUF2568)